MPSRPGSPSFARKLGARIRALREAAAVTQESVAWACGIPKGHLSRIERGERLPSLPVLVSIAKHLRVEPVDALGFDLRKPRIALLDASRRDDRPAVRRALKRLGLSSESG